MAVSAHVLGIYHWLAPFLHLVCCCLTAACAGCAAARAEPHAGWRIAGFKYVRLYARCETPKLYPDVGDAARGRHSARSQGNISSVAVEAPDACRYPHFAEARYTHTVLGPGETLFIPARCWHFVMALTTSISVNFWF